MGKHHHDPLIIDDTIEGVQKYWDTKMQYLTFDSSILEIDGEWIQLDKNLFYPEGGGQPGDTGVIFTQSQKVKVVDTQMRGGKIWLKVCETVLNEGDPVSCSIDENRRLVLSRNHSGQHLLSASFYKLFEADTVRAELRIDENQIDLDKKLNIQEITRAFDLCIDQIAENLDITTRILKKSDLQKYNLRGEVAKVGESGIFRMVQIGDDTDPFDRNLCGGTHVGSTSEILSLSLSKLEAKKIRFRVGISSLTELTRRNSLTIELQRLLNTSENKLIPNIQNLSEENLKNLRKLNKIKAEVIYYKFKEKSWLDGEGFRYKILDNIDGDRSQLGRIFDELGGGEAIICRFSNGVITIASGDEALSSKVFQKMKDAGMKGGGKGRILMGKGIDLDIENLSL